MTIKQQYHKHCEEQESIPIYSRDWWLDIVCSPTKWDVIIIEEHRHIVASMPYYLLQPGVISMPVYTQTMGPWLTPIATDTKYCNSLSKKQQWLQKIIEQISVKQFIQNFHSSITDWLPFYWAGFQQSTRYTYILENIQDTQSVWEGMSTQTHRSIKKAKEKKGIVINQNISLDEFIALQKLTYKRQGLKMLGDEQILRQLITSTQQRKQGDLWAAYDADGQLHAAAFIVWQKSSAYYIAGGSTPTLRQSGAQALLLWEVIQQMASFTNRFDFEGSMLPGVERFFRDFGAKQTPFFTIKKGNFSWFNRGWLKLRRML